MSNVLDISGRIKLGNIGQGPNLVDFGKEGSP